MALDEIPQRPDIPIEKARARLQSVFDGTPEGHARGWDTLWQENFIPWDRRAPNPALEDALVQKADLLGTPTTSGKGAAEGDDGAKKARKRALVPGCGRGYDVYLLAAHGWDAVGLEVSAEAVKSAEAIREPIEGGKVTGYAAVDKELGKGEARFVVGDFFKDDWLKEIGAEAEEAFDLIYDYTFLCALPLELRPRWAATMAHLLSPAGRLFCLEFPLNKEPRAGGPPWAVRPELYLALLQSPGQDVEYDEAGLVRYDAATSRVGATGLERIGRWQPDRTHEVGKGVDMMSVWKHVTK